MHLPHTHSRTSNSYPITLPTFSRPPSPVHLILFIFSHLSTIIHPLPQTILCPPIQHTYFHHILFFMSFSTCFVRKEQLASLAYSTAPISFIYELVLTSLPLLSTATFYRYFLPLLPAAIPYRYSLLLLPAATPCCYFLLLLPAAT